MNLGSILNVPRAVGHRLPEDLCQDGVELRAAARRSEKQAPVKVPKVSLREAKSCGRAKRSPKRVVVASVCIFCRGRCLNYRNWCASDARYAFIWISYFFGADRFFLRGVWANALPAALRPRGLVFADASARPAALAALGLVEARRPVCDRALPAAVLAALVASGFLSTSDAAVAARLRVCPFGLFVAIWSSPCSALRG